MLLLLDTHLVLWSAYAVERMTIPARALIEDRENQLVISAASLWEVAIKAARRRPDFTADPAVLRRSLRDSGYTELDITSTHAIEAAALPPLHKDPFDRLLIGQARVEGMTLVTTDAMVAEYGSPTLLV